MHELAVCQALIEQVERVARDNAARRILSITVSVGPLSGIEAKLLEHAYPLAAAGTVAEEATLVVVTVPVRVRCRTCKAETEAASNRLLCGTCHDWQVDVIEAHPSDEVQPNAHAVRVRRIPRSPRPRRRHDGTIERFTVRGRGAAPFRQRETGHADAGAEVTGPPRSSA